MEREMKHQEVPPPDQQAQEPPLHSSQASADQSKVPPLTILRRIAAGWQSSWLAAIPRLAMQSSRSWRVLAASAVIVGIIAMIFLGRFLFTGMPQQIAPDTKRFFVANQPTLVFDHFIGNVHVMPGPDGQVSIKEQKNGETDAIQIRYAQRGDTIIVTA